MNELQRIDLQDLTIKPRLSPAHRGKKVAICSMAALLALVMIVWLGFLGWGTVEILQWLSVSAKSVWTVLF
jgi:hypothetical protein